MNLSISKKVRRRRRKLARQTVETTHDQLQVTDRVWHHIDYTKPMVMKLVECLQEAHPQPGPILIIGSDSLLAQSLIELGYQVELWHFERGHLTDELKPWIRETVSLEALQSAEFTLPDQGYDAILVPFILDSLPGEPTPFLAQLRRGLAPEGSLILVSTNQSRLDLRLHNLAGRSTAHLYPEFHVSFSFPPLPRRRYYHRDDLCELARKAGFWVRESRYLNAHLPFSAIDPHPPDRFLLLNLQHGLTRFFPSTRHAILQRMTHRVGDEDLGARAELEDPPISVILSAYHDDASLQQSLTTLLQQDYSRDRFEVIVVHDGTSEERKRTIQSSASEGRVTVREIIHSPPEGPAARNAAMRMATGEFCAHTDDACRLPLGWIRTIAFAFEESTGVVVGPVVDEPGSYPPFLTLPGSRPGWEHQGLYPITNVAYRRRAALASGGFDGIKGDDDRPPLAWDTELAWRLQRQGWEGRHLKFMFVYRKYTPPKRLGWLRSEWLLAQDLPRVFRNIPELEDKLLKAGGFASVTTFYFDLLLVGLIAAAVFQHWGFLFLALPYALYYSRFIDLWPMSQWKPSVRHVIAAGARHVVWLAGLLWGSLRARRLVL